MLALASELNLGVKVI